MDRQPPRNGIRQLIMGSGIVLALVLAIGGLAVIGAFVFLGIAMSNFGSNK